MEYLVISYTVISNYMEPDTELRNTVVYARYLVGGMHSNTPFPPSCLMFSQTK